MSSEPVPFLNGMPGVVVSADIEQVVMIAVGPEKDQKTLVSAGFFGLESQFIISPLGIAKHQADVLREGGLFYFIFVGLPWGGVERLGGGFRIDRGDAVQREVALGENKRDGVG